MRAVITYYLGWEGDTPSSPGWGLPHRVQGWGVPHLVLAGAFPIMGTPQKWMEMGYLPLPPVNRHLKTLPPVVLRTRVVIMQKSCNMCRGGGGSVHVLQLPIEDSYLYYNSWLFQVPRSKLRDLAQFMYRTQRG